MSYSLKHLRPQGTRSYSLDLRWHWSEHDAEFVMLHADSTGNGNPAFKNAMARLRAEHPNLASLPSETVLALYIPIYAQHVIADWKHVYNDKGDAVPYSAAECEEFLMTLLREAEDLVNRLFAFAINADNFRGRLDASAVGNG